MVCLCVCVCSLLVIYKTRNSYGLCESIVDIFVFVVHAHKVVTVTLVKILYRYRALYINFMNNVILYLYL